MICCHQKQALTRFNVEHGIVHTKENSTLQSMLVSKDFLIWADS